MFATVAPRYDAANRILSMRLDVLWRRRVARALLDHPGRVLDLAAGTGDLTIELARHGHHRVVGADFTFEMLAHGKAKVRRGAPGSPSVSADALALPFRESSFDACTIAFGIRNFAELEPAFAEIRRVLKPGGTLGILEFSTPKGAFGTLFDFYSRRVLPRIGGLVTGSRAPYEYLPQSVREFPEGKEFVTMFERAGFVKVTACRMSGGIVTFYRGER